MNCTNHGEIPAQAICINCGKALCSACAMPEQRRTFCSPACVKEKDAFDAGVFAVVERSRRSAKVAVQFLFGFGAILVLLALFRIFNGERSDLTLYLLATSAISVFGAYKNMRIYRINA